MWFWSLRNYDGDGNGNGNENVNWKEKAFIKENKNSGLFQAFRQWRVARNEERRGKKEALSPYSHPLSTYSHALSTYSHPSLLTPTPSFLLTSPPLSLPLPYPSLVFFLTFLCSVPLSERLKQTNFSTFRFRHCTTTKWNFLTSNFKFYGKRRHQMKFLLFFPRTWMRFLRIQLQKYSPRFDKFSRSNVFTAMNFETAQIPFFTLTF